MKKIFLLSFCLIAVLGGLSIAFIAFTKKAPQPANSLKDMPVAVMTETVHQQPWQETVLATGSLSAFYGIMIKSETSGRITKKMFEPGTYVKEGTPLVEIYPNILKGQLKKAEAELSLSKANYIRYKSLYHKGFYSKSDLDRQYATMQANEGEVEQLKAQLVQTLIRAPFDGLLGLDQISLGDYLSPGQNVVNLQSLDPIRVDFNLPETILNKLGEHNKVDMQTPAFPNQIFNGQIYAKESIIDSGSRQLACRASIPNEKHQLLPGTFGEVMVYLGNPEQVIIIPQDAVTYTATENFVYRVVNQKAVKTIVTLGKKLQNSEIIITKGLGENDVVVTAGQLKLHDGSPVSLYLPPSTPGDKT